MLGKKSDFGKDRRRNVDRFQEREDFLPGERTEGKEKMK